METAMKNAAKAARDSWMLGLLSMISVSCLIFFAFLILIEPTWPVVVSGGPSEYARDPIKPGHGLHVTRIYNKKRQCPGGRVIGYLDCDSGYRQQMFSGDDGLSVGFTKRTYINEIPKDAPPGDLCEIRVSFIHTCWIRSIRSDTQPIQIKISE